MVLPFITVLLLIRPFPTTNTKHLTKTFPVPRTIERVRAGIMGGCKPAESHVEEREERKEKRTGGSLAAGCCGRVRLCLWPRMPLAAHSQPAAGAEQSSQPTARAGLLPMLSWTPEWQ